MSEAKPPPGKIEVARALLDNGTVFLHVDPRREEVDVPPWLKKQVQVVLQIGLDMPVPIPDLHLDETGLVATLSFSRSPYTCVVPWTGVFAVVGDAGQGMVWPDDMPSEIAAEVEREARRRGLRGLNSKASSTSDAAGAKEERRRKRERKREQERRREQERERELEQEHTRRRSSGPVSVSEPPSAPGRSSSAARSGPGGRHKHAGKTDSEVRENEARLRSLPRPAGDMGMPTGDRPSNMEPFAASVRDSYRKAREDEAREDEAREDEAREDEAREDEARRDEARKEEAGGEEREERRTAGEHPGQNGNGDEDDFSEMPSQKGGQKPSQRQSSSSDSATSKRPIIRPRRRKGQRPQLPPYLRVVK